MRARLLVVDDNPGYRHLVRLALEDDPAFVVVAEAGSADEALSAAARLSPDVALIDVLLPGPGVQLPSILRKAVPSCVVVLTSAHPDGDIDSIRQLGGVAFLPKSVPPAQIGHELAALVAAIGDVHDVLHEMSMQLPAAPESPRAARRFVERALAAWGHDGLVDTVRLLVSELVGNAVLHAASDVELSLRLLPDRLRVDVVDRSTLVPHRRNAGTDEQTGRGSSLVEALTTAWGISGRPDGKSVWFEIALPAPVASAGTATSTGGGRGTS
jgi:DNA-binding NarL/FixJ family response regulator